MDLWIRSQEKDSLMKIDNINLGYQNDENNKSLNELRRLFTFKNNTSFCLGVYKSKERALEVLDEIDEFIDLLNNNLLGMSDDGIHRRHSIYEMPEE